MTVKATRDIVTPFTTLAYKDEIFTVTRKAFRTWDNRYLYDLENDRIKLNIREDMFDTDFEEV